MKAVHKKLNVRQEKFAQLVASGVPATPAYIQAGYKVGQKVAEANGPRLLGNAAVRARVDELTAKTAAKVEFRRENLVAWLVSAIETPSGNLTADSPLAQEVTVESIAGGARGRLKRGKADKGNETAGPDITRTKIKGVGKMDAARLLSEIMGWKKPEEIVVETGPKTLASIEGRAAAVVSALNRRAKATR